LNYSSNDQNQNQIINNDLQYNNGTNNKSKINIDKENPNPNENQNNVTNNMDIYQ